MELNATLTHENQMNQEEMCMVDSYNVIYALQYPDIWKERRFSSLAEIISFLCEREWYRCDFKGPLKDNLALPGAGRAWLLMRGGSYVVLRVQSGEYQ